MLLGWAFHVGFAAFLYACLPYGAGRHQWDVRMSDYNQIKFLLFIDFVLYDFAILGGKVAILLQLNAIFAGHQRNRFFWAIFFLIAVNIIFYVALSFALIFQCQPISKGWNASVPGTCLDQDKLLESSGPFNIVSDFLIFILPIWAILQLQLPLRKRLAVASAFAVGLFGCLCSAVRLYYSNRLNSSGDATYLIFQNQLWAYVPLLSHLHARLTRPSNAEIAAALLIANIIILPRFVRRQRGGSHSSHTYRSGSLQSPQPRPSRYQSTTLHGSVPYGAAAMSANSHPAARDSYIKLDDVPSKERLELEAVAPLPMPDHGIVRTVHIETTADSVRNPARAVVNDRRVGIAR